LSTPYQVQVGNWSYTVENDCTTNYWAILTGSVTDEIFGALYAPGLTVETGREDLPSKVTPNGLYAITGYPQQSFPQLSTMSYPVNLTFAAPGFREFTFVPPFQIPMGSTFPVPVTAVALRRLPVRIQGRTMNTATPRVSLAGALVLSIDDPDTPPAVHATAVRSPLYFGHLNGAAAQTVSMNVTGGTTLQSDSVAGAQVLELAQRTGLGAGSIVRFSNAAQTMVEYGVMDHLGPGPAASAGQVFLRNALNRSYAAASTTVQFVTAMLTGAAATLSGDANAGDGVVLASQLLNGSTLVVDSGNPTGEYHEVGALSDADGYYSLDGMGRVQEIFLQATQGGLQQTTGWSIEYDQPINFLDFRLS
jgi:hypothetical protein